MGFVIVRLIGGLGNQMFQYAMGRALSLRSGAALKLDLSGFATYSKRRYELEAFPICATPATETELAHVAGGTEPRFKLVDRIRRHLRDPAGRSLSVSIYREPHFHFDPTVVSKPVPIYLDGYWQSEKYFSSCAAALRTEFRPLAPLEPENAAVAARIDAVNAVSLHVRRTDYINEAEINRFHGTCSLEYYQRAVAYVGSLVEAPHLFVFSDDHQWARDNLRFGMPMTIVASNTPDRGYRDMQLMARCRHHIIANSSFSWWGAWLNPSADKIVVAPSRWFNASTNDTRDLLPASWVRL
jgi:hypothetical protein